MDCSSGSQGRVGEPFRGLYVNDRVYPEYPVGGSASQGNAARPASIRPEVGLALLFKK